jgi:hypothetical protein
MCPLFALIILGKKALVVYQFERTLTSKIFLR